MKRVRDSDDAYYRISGHPSGGIGARRSNASDSRHGVEANRQSAAALSGVLNDVFIHHILPRVNLYEQLSTLARVSKSIHAIIRTECVPRVIALPLVYLAAVSNPHALLAFGNLRYLNFYIDTRLYQRPFVESNVRLDLSSLTNLTHLSLNRSFYSHGGSDYYLQKNPITLPSSLVHLHVMAYNKKWRRRSSHIAWPPRPLLPVHSHDGEGIGTNDVRVSRCVDCVNDVPDRSCMKWTYDSVSPSVTSPLFSSL